MYTNDLDTMVASFDDETKKLVTRGQLGAEKGRYDYVASFTNGAMLVQLRVDPDGRVGAVRTVGLALFVQAAEARRSTSDATGG